MTKDKAITLLESLGKTSKEVAATLAALNIKGRRKASRSCPISQFLRFHGADSCSTSDCQIIFNSYEINDHLYDHKELISLNPPNNIHAFINDFDAGNYPELESK
jgi:hypothetical protein